MLGGENYLILSRADVTNATVSMLDVVPIDEADGPSSSVIEVGKAFGRKLRAVFGGAKQRLRVSVVIAGPGSRIRGFDAQSVKHRQRRKAHQMCGMIGVIAVMYLPADNFAAIQVEGELEVKPSALQRSQRIRHIATPYLRRFGSNTRGQHRRKAGALATASKRVCSASLKACLGITHTAKGRRLGLIQPSTAFQCCKVRKLIPAISQANMSDMECLRRWLAIFKADLLALPLLNITTTFFGRSSRAATSASSRSLGNNSHFSSLIRWRSCRVACGLALTYSGSASAVVALVRHLSSLSGQAQCSRYHALLPVSSSATVTITASRCAAAIYAGPRAGIDGRSSRQR